MKRNFSAPHFLVGMVALALVASACSHTKAHAAKHTPTPPATASATSTPLARKTAQATPVALSGKVNNHGTKDLALSGLMPTLKLEADDFYFSPTFVKTKPGATVTIEFKNEGKMPHTFTIDKPHIDVELQPGQHKTFTVKLPATPSTVPFYCRFHKGQGMQGAFERSV